MAVNDKDLFAFLGLMPLDIKQRMVACIEAVHGGTVAAHKEQKIQAVEALLTDIQQNPDKYTTAKLKNLFPETLGRYDVSEDLEHRIEVAEQFIGCRNVIKYNTDGTVEQNKHMTYDEFLNSENYQFVFESDYAKRKKRKK